MLPGVTVEAASPALIEQVRSVVTDGTGRYIIQDLRPGLYTVTFTLDPLPAHDCCDIHATPGCSNPLIEACVCESSGNSDCCSSDWDSACVQAVTDENCGQCTGGGLRGEDGPAAPVARPAVARTVAFGPGVNESVIPDRLFATDLSFPAKHLLELDPADGTVAPESGIATATGSAQYPAGPVSTTGPSCRTGFQQGSGCDRCEPLRFEDRVIYRAALKPAEFKAIQKKNCLTH
ncbi:MAG: carboxypeptidase regulatory-like domain-containing protein [Nitrospinae bacterium]|nr:carboxypeptidase regulatory-like domain-containing protein [Nitrospinota bacterium]